MKLFLAAHKLLMFVLHEASAQTLSEEERALREALRPLVENKDGHFIAAVTALVQSLEGRTDCPISGVFGAGKTLSAAAMIAGLLVMDPTLHCHDCWTASDGPHTPNHDCYQGKCCGVCLCKALSETGIA